MTGINALLLGLGLGLRHATDADHVVVVSAMLQREPGLGRAVRVAALWGAGHTTTCTAVGLAVVLAGVRVPPSIERAAEWLVIALLLGFGLAHAWRGLRASPTLSSTAPGSRPLIVGMLHGLAGSAGVALLALTTIDSRFWAAAYLGLFGAGTVVGMTLLTMVLSLPLSWMVRRSDRTRRVAVLAAAACSLGLALLLALQQAGQAS